MSQDITVTDLFCGAGGSSIGAEAAGARLVMAANHWRLAIETHNSNFPDADHDCADVSQVDPRRYPSTDILIASPECTNHSSAKTNKHRTTIWDPTVDPSEERSRATMWDVPRFAEYHRYALVVVENVVEARNWAPFPAWLAAMDSLGYAHRAVYLNSMVAHPTPQSRDRMYVVFWRRGNTAPDLDIRPVAWCASCERDVAGIQSWKSPTKASGKYRAQYVYRCPACAGIALPYAWPAAAAIDWSLPAPRIGDRGKPLADATLRRIRAGLERYGPSAIVQAAGHTFERAGYYRTWAPLGTQTTTIQHALVVETAYAGKGDADKSRTTDDPLRTLTTVQTQALVTRPARDTREPLATQTGRQTMGLVVPAGETWRDDARPTGDPFATRTGNETDALVVPLRNHGQARPTTEPVATVSAEGNHHALLIRNYSGGAEMTKPVTAPTGTITAVDHHALVTTFLTDYHGEGQPAPVTDPHRTMDTRDRYGLVAASFEVEDCGFRMLEPHEIGRAMAFDDGYIVLGNKRERVRQYGNAVTPPVMALILGRAIASLAGGKAVA